VVSQEWSWTALEDRWNLDGDSANLEEKLTASDPGDLKVTV